jgi:SAM-dependent methyltransferase
VTDALPDIDPASWADPAATYDGVAGAYAEQFLSELEYKPFDRELLIRFSASVASGASGASATRPVCDIGCGPGHIGAFVAQQGLPVVGLDLSEGMVDEARRRFPSLSFSLGDMTALPQDDATLSGIVCFYALIHLPRVGVPVALREMHRVLVPGGPLLLSVHGGAGVLHATRMADQPADLHATLFSLTELTGLLTDAGFDIVEAWEREPYPDEHPTPRLYVWGVRRN